jgi:ABC-2 type transport system ATP-binding protein
MHSVVLSLVDKVFRQTSVIPFRRKIVETRALSALCLEVSRGEVLCLLGPNGSGKSTTLKLISAMLLPDSGDVLVNGANTRKQSQAVRRQVGFALASERSFFPRLTARENLEFFAALENVPSSERRDRLDYVLGEVKLLENAGKQVMKFSSGMYQRLGIARALIKHPRVLLLDEPSRSLDPAGANHLWNLVRELASAGITVVLATHNFAEAVAVSDRIAVLDRGRLIALRRTGELSVEGLRDFYLTTTSELVPLPRFEEVPA